MSFEIEIDALASTRVVGMVNLAEKLLALKHTPTPLPMCKQKSSNPLDQHRSQFSLRLNQFIFDIGSCL